MLPKIFYIAGFTSIGALYFEMNQFLNLANQMPKSIKQEYIDLQNCDAVREILRLKFEFDRPNGTPNSVGKS